MANAQVQLVCLAPTLVITSIEKTAQQHPFHPFLARDNGSNSDDTAPQQPQPQSHALLIPTLLELLFYSPERTDTASQRFLSYVETQHEISIVLEEQLVRMFPPGALQCEPTRWKALQVASAGTGAFLTQLAVLTELTTQLAQHRISVFQISTYQTDYVLVKVEDLATAIRCLASFCYVEIERSDDAECVDARGIELAYDDAADSGAPIVDPATELAVHRHLLSVPDIDLFLVQIDKASVRHHMFSLVRLLFGCGNSSAGACRGNLFLSYSETGDDISVVTHDRAFVDELQALAADGGVMVSPDAWKVVQVGDTNLGFNETGIVAGQTRVLLQSGTMVFYLSTFATDFMMIKEDEWADALAILRSHFSVLEGQFAPLQAAPAADASTAAVAGESTSA